MSDKNWGGYQYKGETPVEDPEVPRHHAKKDTRTYCKGKVGHPHTPEVTLKALYGVERQCGPNQWGLHRGNWTCWHWMRCTTCGRYLRKVFAADCPARTH